MRARPRRRATWALLGLTPGSARAHMRRSSGVRPSPLANARPCYSRRRSRATRTLAGTHPAEARAQTHSRTSGRVPETFVCGRYRPRREGARAGASDTGSDRAAPVVAPGLPGPSHPTPSLTRDARLARPSPGGPNRSRRRSRAPSCGACETFASPVAPLPPSLPTGLAQTPRARLAHPGEKAPSVTPLPSSLLTDGALRVARTARRTWARGMRPRARACAPMPG